MYLPLRPFVGLANEIYGFLHRAGAARLGTTWRRRPLPRAESVDALSPAAHTPNCRIGRGRARRSRGDEFAHGEPAPDDGVFLPSNQTPTKNSGRARLISLRSICGRVANPLSRI